MKLKNSLAVLLLVPSYLAAVQPYFSIRSQSEAAARQLAGWAHKVNLYDPEELYGTFAAIFEYTRSFDATSIEEKLFGKNDCCECQFIRVAGSRVPTRAEGDWMADYFGLPTDYESILTFKPRIENIIIDLAAYIGLDDILNGLYIRGHAPIVHTSWDLNFCEQRINPGVNGYDAGYMSPQAVQRSHLLDSFTEYVSCQDVPNLGGTTIFESLKNGRFSTRAQTLTRLADLRAAIGWNFCQNDSYHFGLNIRGAAPTGNRPDGDYLFEPIVGNGHHWELGLGLTSHYRLWLSQDCTQSAGLYLDANVTHLFSARQRRTFDLVRKPFSRFMLAERLGVPVRNLFANATQGTAAGSTAPVAQFKDVLAPVANISTFDVDVSSGAQANVVFMFNYANCNTSFDIGYEFWGRTCSKIRPICGCLPPFNNNQNWALKGDSFIYGFVAQDANPIPADLAPGDAVALSATQRRATISTGRNTLTDTVFDPTQRRNPGIDNPQFAMFATDDDSQQLVVQPGDNGGNDTQQRTSKEPLFIICEDFDLVGARTKGISNSLFTHISYTWNHKCWQPYLGVGGKFEVARDNLNDCFADFADDSCQDSANSEWGVWVKGGISF